MPPDRPKKRWQGDAPPENNSKHHKSFKKTKSQPYNDAVPTGLAAIKKKLRDTERLLKRVRARSISRECQK
ncbi:hypothetical protein BC937DRAFT_87608 [Endogone sp. FLAS-F59071]|nr:hypothetical protein BC937DRAFT_87608 [Endogone sp. FLAS-F59071]|eukprot:RUS22726.1 hypothetical protein BC937DRAFT_87608 [Endogone sp. FLAS-F59071]